MINFKTRIATAFATGAVLLNALAPLSFASTQIIISGNGTDSNNDANVSATNTTTVVQDNTANINNNVNVDADTGHNKANDNTGGNVSIATGNVDTNVDVKNVANSNKASVDQCCEGKADVLISGNGSHSDNTVDLNLDHSVTLVQTNDAHIDNKVDVDADTGHNKADDNTGGDVSITTGNVDTTVKLATVANANSATIGGGNGNGGGTISAWILGNGTGSDNNIALDLTNDVVLVQDNTADINNDVDVDADTGHNKANDNTGGDVDILTGDVDATVSVDNLVNFNGADINECGCLTDLLAKISGNGSDSDSTIDFTADNLLTAFQTNDSYLDNNVDADHDTGWNKAKDNTGGVDSKNDPTIETGDATSDVTVHNTGNKNVFGQDLGHVLDGIDFNFDWSGFLSLFWGHSEA